MKTAIRWPVVRHAVALWLILFVYIPKFFRMVRKAGLWGADMFGTIEAFRSSVEQTPQKYELESCQKLKARIIEIWYGKETTN